MVRLHRRSVAWFGPPATLGLPDGRPRRIRRGNSPSDRRFFGIEWHAEGGRATCKSKQGRRPLSIQSVEQDGEWLTLTPAYDICPQPRSGGETSQAMMIGPDGFRMCQLAGCLERASTYMLPEIEARELIDHQVEVIERAWNEVAERARMTEVERSFFWRRRFLNPYAFEGYHAQPPIRRRERGAETDGAVRGALRFSAWRPLRAAPPWLRCHAR
ncbi:MAG: hypothetical protein ACR2NB_15570 [Solirubrobacteraceae bacterium]